MREEKRDEKRDGHSHQTTLVTSKYYLLLASATRDASATRSVTRLSRDCHTCTGWTVKGVWSVSEVPGLHTNM